MWNLIKGLAVAALVGAGAGIVAKGRIDKAINGPAPEKLPKSKYRVIEIPEDTEVENVDIIVTKKGEKDKKPEK